MAPRTDALRLTLSEPGVGAERLPGLNHESVGGQKGYVALILPDVLRPAIAAPLRHRQFRRLWLGQTLSAIGNGISLVALTLLILARPHASRELGYVLAAQSLGLIGFVVVGGHLADRLRRTTMMAAADGARILATVGLAVLGTHGVLGGYIALALLLGVGAALFDPAERALLPMLVPDEDLQSANALNAVTSHCALIIGAPLGGLLVALAGPRAAFLVDAVTFAVSISTILAIRTASVDAKPAGEADQPAPGGALDGLRALRARPWAAAVMAQGAVQVLLVHAPLAVLVPLVLAAKHESASYGVLLAVQAMGSVIGAVGIARWKVSEPGTVALLGMLAGLPTMIFLLLRSPVPVIAVGMALSGLGGAVFAVLWSSALQRNIPDAVLGRVVALDYVTQLGLEPAGLALTAPAVIGIGLSPVIGMAAATLAVTTVAPFAVPRVRTFGDEATPRKTGAEAVGERGGDAALLCDG